MTISRRSFLAGTAALAAAPAVASEVQRRSGSRILGTFKTADPPRLVEADGIISLRPGAINMVQAEQELITDIADYYERTLQGVPKRWIEDE
jgi:hypothetical protein